MFLVGVTAHSVLLGLEAVNAVCSGFVPVAVRCQVGEGASN